MALSSECPICFEDIDIEKNKNIITTCCKKNIHKYCLAQSIQLYKRCPLCNTDINTGTIVIVKSYNCIWYDGCNFYTWGGYCSSNISNCRNNLIYKKRINLILNLKYQSIHILHFNCMRHCVCYFFFLFNC